MSGLFLTSPLLPFAHGFSTRLGGTSEGPFASLNLGFSVGDEAERVEENFRRLARAAGVPAGSFVTTSQVHGDRVLEVVDGAAQPHPADRPPPPQGEADALFTDRPGIAVGVKTADCVPILIADPESGRVAAVHSGWRGTELRIAARAVEALCARGSDPKRLVAAIGPAIQACCYEVSDELGERFSLSFGDDVVRRARPRPHLDLPGAVRKALEHSGLAADRIDVLPHCTSCDAGRFFSHRRGRGVKGLHLSFVVGGQSRSGSPAPFLDRLKTDSVSS
jgi:polyphenol oxidase